MLSFEKTFIDIYAASGVRILFPISVCGVNNFLVNYMLSLLMLLILIWGLCFRLLLVDYWIRMFEVSRSVGVLVLFF